MDDRSTPPPSIQKTISTGSTQSVASSSSSSSSRKRNPADFQFGKILGEGSYSTVLYACEPARNREYAVKILDKHHIVKEKKVKYVTVEKDVLHRLKHPFCIKLYYTFQDMTSLYFVLEYCPNGDILGLLRQKGRFEGYGLAFYIAEIIAGLDHIHSSKVLHRDLKPENILLDKHLHVKITDFGSAKMLDKEPESEQGERKRSFVGTAEYCSPEMLNREDFSFASDVWALGCIVYQFSVGVPPFRGSNEYQTFQKIIKLEYDIPEGVDDQWKGIVQSILTLEADKRPGLKELMEANVFKEIIWHELPKLVPPSLPVLEPFIKPVIPEQFVDSDLDIAELQNGVNPLMLSPDSYEQTPSNSSSDSVDLQTPTIDAWQPPNVQKLNEIIKIDTLKKVYQDSPEIGLLFQA